MKTISILNLKGGVAKTFTAVNMAYELYRRGFKVMLIDNDKQGNASRAYGRYDAESVAPITKLLSGEWQRAGEIIQHTEYEGIDIIAATMLLEVYGIRPLKIGYDRYSAQYLITDMANYGFHMDDVYQGENLTPVIREFEGIIKDGNFKIADNNLLKTHFLNVALKHNMETRKFRPIKIEQRAHIDGFVSVIDAMTVRQKYWEECGELLKNAA